MTIRLVHFLLERSTAFAVIDSRGPREPANGCVPRQITLRWIRRHLQSVTAASLLKVQTILFPNTGGPSPKSPDKSLSSHWRSDTIPSPPSLPPPLSLGSLAISFSLDRVSSIPSFKIWVSSLYSHNKSSEWLQDSVLIQRG